MMEIKLHDDYATIGVKFLLAFRVRCLEYSPNMFIIGLQKPAIIEYYKNTHFALSGLS